MTTDDEGSAIEELLAALKKKNFRRFVELLETNDIDLENVPKGFSFSIFEECCLAPGSAIFIRECIKRGCDVNKDNGIFVNRKPINFATESQDPDNIKTLLENGPILVDNIFNGKTPIQYLALEIANDNFEEISQCIRHLIANDADVNIPDHRLMTPILTLAEKTISPSEKYVELLQHILDSCPVDLDSYCDGEAREELTKNFPQLNLPEKSTKKVKWDFHLLAALLKERKEQTFIDSLTEFLEQTKRDESHENILREHPANETLLTLATSNNLYRAVEKLLFCGDNPTDELYGKSSTLTSPFQIACRHGYYGIMVLFLDSSSIDVNSETYLITIIKKVAERPKHLKEFQNCFELLLRIPDIDLNCTDNTGNTPLHYAVRNNLETFTLKLLERGASISIKNGENKLAIYQISPKILEKHFNNCITTNGLPPSDEDFKMDFKHSNFVSNQASSEKHGAVRCDMNAIGYIAKSDQLKHLIQHPLISSYLFLKWNRLSIFFYINFLCYTMYCMSMISFLLYCYGNNQRNVTLYYALLSACVIGALYVLIREIVQFALSPRRYVQSFENWLEAALIILTIFELTLNDQSSGTHRAFSAITILLAVYEFFVLTGSLPVLSFSTHLVMLTTVSKNFLKSIMLYSIILIAFALCFHILLGQGGDETTEFNDFTNPALAILKTVVMMTGEMDASNIEFSKNGFSYALFLTFVFMISTVMFNLLNGLAVSDTQAIQSEAELVNFLHMVELILRYDKVIEKKGVSRGMLSVFKTVPQDYAGLYIEPNKNSIIRVYIKGDQDANNDSNSDSTSRSSRDVESQSDGQTIGFAVKLFSFSCAADARMDMKIVQWAKMVLDAKDKENEEENEKKLLVKQMKNIEKQIENIEQQVENIEKEFENYLENDKKTMNRQIRNIENQTKQIFDIVSNSKLIKEA